MRFLKHKKSLFCIYLQLKNMFKFAASGSNAAYILVKLLHVQRSKLSYLFRLKWINTFVENPHIGV